MNSQVTNDQQLAHDLAELIDKVMVRKEAGFAVQQQLGSLMDEWKQTGGSGDGASLIQKSQGLVGMVNASHSDGPSLGRAYHNLTEYKQELRRIAAGHKV
jgi:hypothetical protein